MKFLFPLSNNDIVSFKENHNKNEKNHKITKWLFFKDPIKVIKLYPDIDSEILKQQIRNFFKTLENENYPFAGFFSYDLSLFLHFLKRNVKKNSLISLPLIYGGFFSSYRIIENLEEFIDFYNDEKGESFINEIQILESFSSYKKNIEQIRRWIMEGKVYQINYTFPLQFKIYGNLYYLFYILWKKQMSPNACLIEDDDFFVISISPELFFYQNQEEIILKPMKGSYKKSKSLRNNIQAIKYLKDSKKEVAENAMITDLIRNDVGKISKIGSVKIQNLYKIEIYETIIQMITEIHAKLESNCKKELFWNSLFPSGSVTGAPKLSAMQFIESLETYNRHLYTGSIGWIIENKAKFNVAIRTIFGTQNTAYYYVGSGITYDSIAKREFYECIYKARVIKEAQNLLKPEYIFTTMKFSGGIIYFEKSHLERLSQTKRFFQYRISSKKIKDQFIKLKKRLQKFKYPIRIHFRIYKNGKIRIYLDKLYKKKQVVIGFSDITTNKKDIFLRFKTSNRSIYNNAFKTSNPPYDEILFKNNEGFITEGSYTNIIIKKGEEYQTPHLENGLLNGIMRQKLVHRFKILEKNLKEEDVREADEIYLVNSVRGILKGLLG